MLAACRLLLAAAVAAPSAAARPAANPATIGCIKLLDLGIMMGGPKSQPTLLAAMAETERIVTEPVPEASSAEVRPSKRQRQAIAYDQTAGQLSLPPRMAHATVSQVQRR